VLYSKVIFYWIDDIGRKFYIIITGSVYVLLNSDGAVGSETSRSISFRGGDEEDEISYQTRDKLPEYMAKNELTDSQKKVLWRSVILDFGLWGKWQVAIRLENWLWIRIRMGKGVIDYRKVDLE
jgi:hypothetical protein